MKSKQLLNNFVVLHSVSHVMTESYIRNDLFLILANLSHLHNLPLAQM